MLRSCAMVQLGRVDWSLVRSAGVNNSMKNKAVLRTSVWSFALLTAGLAASVSAQQAAKPKPRLPVAASTAPALPPLTASQVVEKNVAARGGLSVWQATLTISWKGTMGAGGTVYEATTPKSTLERKERPEIVLPFTMEFKRPLKSRIEIEFNGQTAVQVYDGANGWKLRPYLNRNDWEAFKPDELKLAAVQPDIDGWLINYAAKSIKVESAGTDMVEAHAASKLKVVRKDGQVRHVWVDGQTFLDIKMDGDPRKLDGRPHGVAIYLRDFKNVQGLMIPFVLETVVQGVPKSEKVTIETVAVNPKLDDARFTKGK